jgi:transposase InsO family protein
LKRTNYVALVKPRSKWKILIKQNSQMSTHRPLELLHMDLFGPTSFVSIGGNSYCLLIVDDYSRFTWVYFLRDKSNVFETFKSFTILAQNQFESDIKKVRSDNGSEF